MPLLRRTPMTLAAVVLLASLSACGSEEDATGGVVGREPTPSSSPSPDLPPDPSPDQPSDSPTEPSDQPSAGPVPGQEGEGWRLVEIVSEPATGGEVSGSPVRIDDPESLETFSSQFTRDGLVADLQRIAAASDPQPGTALVAAVVGVGCDVPTGVSYADGQVAGLKVPDPLPNCFAPVTSVAVLEVAEPPV